MLNWIAITLWLLWALLGVWGLPYASAGEGVVSVGIVVVTLCLNIPVILLKKRTQFVDFVKTCGIVVNSLVFLGLSTAFVISMLQGTDWIDMSGGFTLLLTVAAPVTTVTAIAIGRRGLWWERST